MKYGKAYGNADPELIEGDIFRIIVKVPEYSATDSATVTGNARVHATGHKVTGEVFKLLKIFDGEMKRSEIQQHFSLKHEDHFREAYLLPALHTELIEMTIPEKPTSSKQKYRLTEKGRAIVKGRE